MKKKATLPPLANQCGLSRPRDIVADGWVGKQLVVILSVYAYQSFPR